ncbi:ATP-grasp domain-containing protein [Roseixanthobacter pseudopolyaromaticivorans]|uniref:ATP-grasp domain-containing protein n=1 Tax=Xanthobacteraceae TaxID=335928 RepID=UPI0037272FF7
MRVFVCEFVTSGGLRDKALPQTLLPEGTLMRDAMVSDLENIPGVQVVLCHDDRLAPPRADSVPVAEGEDPWAVWARLAGTAHVVWPVAPETDGLLERLVALARTGAARVIASEAAALRIAGRKSLTAQHLAAAGIPHIPTYALAAMPDTLAAPLVTKPDDGAGATQTHIWRSLDALRAAQLPPAGLIVQPYVAGVAASLTVLCRPDGVTLLTANLQELAEDEGRLSLTGLTVGCLPDADGKFAALARAVVAAIPGLSGIIGIDLIMTEDGPVVVEVNPRITTSYAGLHASLGINPAAFLPELIRDGRPPAVPHLPMAVPVEVKVR